MARTGFDRVGGVEGYMKAVEEFHGFHAPGVIIGGFMVDLAVREMAGHELLDAVVETRQCLVDAVQLLTPCSIGNGWIKIINSGRYALTMYDKNTLEGVRVFIDPEKIKAFHQIEDWFFRRVSKKDLPLEVLNPVILEAGEAILSTMKVKVSSGIAPKGHAPKPKICSECGEPYRGEDPERCAACIHPYYEAAG